MNPENQKLFELWGLSRVRTELYSGKILPHLKEDAFSWVSEQEHADRLASEASQASQMR